MSLALSEYHMKDMCRLSDSLSVDEIGQQTNKQCKHCIFYQVLEYAIK